MVDSRESKLRVLKLTHRRIRGFVRATAPGSQILTAKQFDRIGMRVEKSFGPLALHNSNIDRAAIQFILQVGEVAARKLRRQERVKIKLA